MRYRPLYRARRREPALRWMLPTMEVFLLLFVLVFLLGPPPTSEGYLQTRLAASSAASSGEIAAPGAAVIEIALLSGAEGTQVHLLGAPLPHGPAGLESALALLGEAAAHAPAAAASVRLSVGAGVPYGEVVRVIDLCGRRGFARVDLVMGPVAAAGQGSE